MRRTCQAANSSDTTKVKLKYTQSR